MTTAVFNTEIGKVENKIPDVSSLVKKTVYDAKLSKIEEKHLTDEYYKFMSEILA